MSNPYAEIEKQFFSLRGQLATGRITPKQFEAALQQLIVQDEQGRFWTINPNSGEWHVHDGKNWIRALPPTGEISSPPLTLPEPPSHKTLRAPTSAPLITLGGMILVAIIILFGTIIYFLRPADNLAQTLLVTPTPVSVGTPPVSGIPIKIVAAFDSQFLSPQDFAANAENLATAVARLNHAQLQFIADAKISLAHQSPARFMGLALPLFFDPKTDRLDQDLREIAANAMTVGRIADGLAQTMASQDNASDQSTQAARPFANIAQMAYALVIDAQNLRDKLFQSSLTRDDAVHTIAEYGARMWNPTVAGLNNTTKPSTNTINPFISELANPASVSPVKFLNSNAANQFKTQMTGKDIRLWVAMDNAATQKQINVPLKSITANPHDPALLTKLSNPTEQVDADRARQVALAQFDRANISPAKSSAPPTAQQASINMQAITVEPIEVIDQVLTVVEKNGTASAISKAQNSSGGNDVIGDMLNLVGDQSPQVGASVQVKPAPPAVKISLQDVRLDKIEEFPISGSRGYEADIAYSFTVVWETTLDSRSPYIYCRGTDETRFITGINASGSQRIKMEAVGLGPRRTTELIECELGRADDVRQKLAETYRVLDLMQHFKFPEPVDDTDTPTATSTSTKTPIATSTTTNTPTRTATLKVPPTATRTPTKNPAFTMNGTFSLNWSNAEGYRAQTSGLIKLTVDTNTGKVTGFLSGSGNGTKPNTCVPNTPWTNKLTYEEDFDGIVDLKTGALSAAGMVTGSNTSDQKTCHCKSPEVPVPYCEKGGETTPLTFKISLDGTVDLKNHTGKGRNSITTCTTATCEGDWHAGE